MKKLDWLADFAESQKAKFEKKNANGKKVVASKKAVAEIQNADMIIMPKSRLQNAENGNTVKYKNCKWKVVNASYKDAKGAGVVLKKIATIDTKKVTDPEVRARKEDVDFQALDYNVSEGAEVPKFNEEAQSTTEAIAKEDAKDRTTPAGRYTADEAMVDDFASVDAEPMEMEMGTSEEFGEDALTDTNAEEDASAEDEVAEVTDAENEEAPTEEDFASDADADFADVDAEDEVDVTDDNEDAIVEDDEDKKEEVKASVKRQNRIIAAMLKA